MLSEGVSIHCTARNPHCGLCSPPSRIAMAKHITLSSRYRREHARSTRWPRARRGSPICISAGTAFTAFQRGINPL
ncbi:hypothetical protein K0T92_20260 [Paenibacillus oenotherae]|uniref:Uncharacterized protein n=1 Tax=Paenibacillus oenotherae TaxID=1435645 RepID=A0ABS7DAZ5_9BACL|nr:hypothetical protein [Paenibacillus oenotherae]